MAGLGRGLGSLLSESKKGIEARAQIREAQAQAQENVNTESVENNVEQVVSDPKNVVSMIKVDLLVPSVYQPRKSFDEDSIRELAESIKEHGVLEPLLVKKIDDKYNIICGERRYRASQVAGIAEVPCLVRDDLETDSYAIALIDNIQREDLNPIEMAQAFASMIEECSLTQEELAKTLGKSRSSIANILRLNNLQDDVKKMVIASQIDLGHAKVLLALEDPDFQLKAALYVIKNSLNVRQTEELVKDIKENGLSEEKKNAPKKEKFENSSFDIWKKAISSRFDGLKVKFSALDENKGKVTLAYSSKDQLDKLMALLSDGINVQDNDVTSFENKEPSSEPVEEESVQEISTEENVEAVEEVPADETASEENSEAVEEVAVEEVPADETASEENVEAVEEVPADETASEENVEVVEEISADETVAEENVEAVEEIPAEEILSEENIVEDVQPEEIPVE